MTNEAVNPCRVCGYLLSSPPWGADGQSPTFEYCPSCGVEFGYEDSNIAGMRAYRERWLATGARWAERGGPPPCWNPEEQLTNIPEPFR